MSVLKARRILPAGAAVEAAHRARALLSLAALVGVVTGITTAGVEEFAGEGVLAGILKLPTPAIAAAPLVGLALSVWIVKLFCRRRRVNHAHTYGRITRRVVDSGWSARSESGRLYLPAGLGAALGFEGPSILIGGTFGSLADRRFTRRFRADDAKILMVAGAAAGVAAIFKAPLTGIVFALEVPYHRDLARRALIPALAASSVGTIV